MASALVLGLLQAQHQSSDCAGARVQDRSMQNSAPHSILSSYYFLQCLVFHWIFHILERGHPLACEHAEATETPAWHAQIQG